MTPVQAVAVCAAGVAFAGLFLWLIPIVLTLRGDVDAARDESDRALGGVQNIHDHLAGSEPASKGRHAATHSRPVIALSDRRTDELPVAGVSRPPTLSQGIPSQTKRGLP